MRAGKLIGRGIAWALGLAGAALLDAALLGGARAEMPPAPAAAPSLGEAPSVPLTIWYRSSEGCPDGAVFVARLAELGRRAMLARVGDRVDFVVTVGSASSASTGRLERQTARGTVAIRELDAPRCDEVTEALALSLDIALDPAGDAPSAASASSAATVASLAATPSPPLPPERGAPSARPADAGPSAARFARGPLQLGAQASLAKGIAPGWTPGGAVFAELRSTGERPFAGRLSLGAAFADDTVAAIDVDVLWLAGRVEGCAFELRSGRLSIEPCLGAELGLLRGGSSGAAARTDAGIWGAALGHVRASLELDERFALEAQVGAVVPFVRYGVGSSLGGNLFRTEPVVLGLAVGGRWSP